MHPHTATSAILRRGLTIRDLQCPPADADTVTSITIDDTIRAAKGNFGFVYAATGDRELYRECLLAESYAKTQYVSCAIHLRRAFELLAFYTVGRALCTVTPGLTMPEAKAHAKQFYESDPRCFNPKLQLSLVLAGLGYIDVVFNERFAFSDNPAYPGCKKMVDMLFSLYSDASGMAHTGRDGGHRDCSWLLRRFYTAAGMLLQVDVPAADFFPAMDRFLHRYDASVVPLENYYPLSAAVCRQMDVCAADDSLLCVTDEAAPTFYIAKHVTDDPAVGRDIGSLQSLWRASEQTPENVLMDVGPLGAGEDRYHLFRIVGRPYALSAKVLAGLNSTQKRQIINGIVGSIYTLHHFMPPLPHRGLRPGCYYVCRQGANCRAVLALFSTIKDNTAEKTVYGELNSLLQNVTDRMYIAPELSGGSARPGELTKADIYSLGRLIAFVYTGEPRADLDDLRIPCAMVELVQKLTDPDPARRPDIDAVRARLENGGQRLVYGAAACQGTRPRQADRPAGLHPGRHSPLPGCVRSAGWHRRRVRRSRGRSRGGRSAGPRGCPLPAHGTGRLHPAPGRDFCRCRAGDEAVHGRKRLHPQRCVGGAGHCRVAGGLHRKPRRQPCLSVHPRRTDPADPRPSVCPGRAA